MPTGTKGEQTRQRVIERAAPVFNQRGYWGATLRDVMQASGLEKGGIYNHFENKDALALAAFEHNINALGAGIRGALAGKRGAVERLRALLGAYVAFVKHPPFPGGCPILNAAVDSDDTHPALRARVRQAMDDLRGGTFARVLARGVERAELRPDLEVEHWATVFTATLEGALMLSQLYDDARFIEQAAAHLEAVIPSLTLDQEDK